MVRHKAYIIDDESLARYTLKKKLEEFPEIEIIGEANCINDALHDIRQMKPDVLFLDIELSEGTGFDLLNMLEFQGKVIFVTAYNKYAIRAFEINALDYLLKPVSSRRLENAVGRLNQGEHNTIKEEYQKLRSDDRILLMVRNFIYFIKINDIVTISSSGDYTSVRSIDNKEYLVSKTMNEWEERLPEQRFCRISRSMIVNFNFVEKTEKWFNNTAMVYVSGYDEPIKLSKSYFKKVKERYK